MVLVFNLDIDAKNNPSSYAFNTVENGLFYFRPYKGDFLSTWDSINNIDIEFIDEQISSNIFTINLTKSNIVEINSEKLMEVKLPSNMMSTNALFKGLIKINKSKSLMMDIIIYSSGSQELEKLKEITQDYEEELRRYLTSVKKYQLDAKNGVAKLDAQKKIFESYLPNEYKDHIATKIISGIAHEIKLDSKGILWYYDREAKEWKMGNGQNPNGSHKPPTITVRDGIATVKHDQSTLVVLQKWDYGVLGTGYFASKGNNMNGSTFPVDRAGMYTYYYMTADDDDYVLSFEVKEEDVPFQMPTITIDNGKISIKHKDQSRIDIQKWGEGSLPVSFFGTQGTVIIDNGFLVEKEGVYTIYYKLKDGREYVQEVIVRETDLPKDVMPTLSIKDGLVTVKYADHMVIEVDKWDIEERDISYFQSNGFIIENEKFYVTKAGIHTLYFKTSRGNEYVVNFTVRYDQLKPEPYVDIKVVNGVVKVTYPDWFILDINKWEIGSKDILYFRDSGNAFTGREFTIEEAGTYTLYYRDIEGREYVKIFTVSKSEVPPTARPSYVKRNGYIEVIVENKSIYDANLYEYSRVTSDYFTSGNGKTVIDWKIPIESKGTYSHYYHVIDGRSGVSYIEITNDDLSHNKAKVIVTSGLARVTNNQPQGVDVILQKWSAGSRDIEYFQSNGTIIVDNKFYVSVEGTHTLYYKLSNGGEYVQTFTVSSSQLEKPWQPATIEIVYGKVSVTYPTSSNVILQKWDLGNRDISWFSANGNIFTGRTFNVTTVGMYTLYYKLDNDREYVQTFNVKEEDLMPKFIPPIIAIVRGVVTLKYESSMNVTLKKWDYGNKEISYFETGGEVISNNTFTVTQTGIHTLYSVLDDEYKYKTIFNVDFDNLPQPDKPPIITVSNGIVFIQHDPKTQVKTQKYDFGERDIEYFKNGGATFVGGAFKVDSIGKWTYWYKNIYDEEYVYIIDVKGSDLPFYKPIIEVYDGVMSVTFISPKPPTVSKFDVGIKDKDYFTNDGIVLVNNTHPINSAGKYTLYWKEVDGRDFIEVFDVLPQALEKHKDPIINVEDYDVDVTWDAVVKPLTKDKKWEYGVKDLLYFKTKGNSAKDDSFVVDKAGQHTYYYIYRTRGYLQEFFVWIPPEITKKYGTVKVNNNVDLANDIAIQKWDSGSRNIEWFQTNGNNIVDGKFNVSAIGEYSIYTKLNSGEEFVTILEIYSPDLEIPKPSINISESVATISWHSTVTPTLQKWDKDSKDIAWFKDNGNIINDNKFSVNDAGIHTLYYVLDNEYEFVMEFNVLEDQLSPPYRPKVNVKDNVLMLTYPEGKIVSESRYQYGEKVLSDFIDGKPLGIGNPTHKNRIFIDQNRNSSFITIYYKYNDGFEEVFKYNLTNSDLFKDKNQVQLSTLVNGETFKFANGNYMVLDSSSGLVAQLDLEEERAFDTSKNDKFNTTRTSNVGYYLNNTYYNSLSQDAKNSIITHGFDISKDPAKPEIINANIGLMDRFKGLTDSFMLFPAIKFTPFNDDTEIRYQRIMTLTPNEFGDTAVTYIYQNGTTGILKYGEKAVAIKKIKLNRTMLVDSYRGEKSNDYSNIKTNIKNGIVNVSYEGSYVRLISQKCEQGAHDISYFQNNGTEFTSHGSFMVEYAGDYTIYTKLENGIEKVDIITVTEDDLYKPFPDMVWGLDRVAVFSWGNNPVPNTIKYAQGNQPITYFNGGLNGIAVNGNPDPDNNPNIRTAIINYTGTHTIYIKDDIDREYVMTFEIVDSWLQQPVSPTFINDIDNEKVIISNIQDPDMVVEKKWDYGIRDTNYFKTSGNTITSDEITPDRNGDMTFYIKYFNYKDYVFTHKANVLPSYIENATTGQLIEIDGKEYLAFGGRYVCERESIGLMAFDSQTGHAYKYADPTRYSNIAYYLNNTHYDSLSQYIKDNIEDVQWNISGNIPRDKNNVIMKVGLLTDDIVLQSFVILDNYKAMMSKATFYGTLPNNKYWGMCALDSDSRPRYYLENSTSNGLSSTHLIATNKIDTFPMYRLKEGTKIIFKEL